MLIRRLLLFGSCLMAPLGCSSSRMRCPSRGDDPQALLDDLDVNSDGTFTEEDLQWGESVMLYRFTQVDGKSRLVVSRDDSVQGIAHIYEPGGEVKEWGAKSLFGVWHEFSDCSQEGWITPWFSNEDDSQPLPDSGRGPLYTLIFDIASIEHGPDEVFVDGHMNIVVGKNGGVSGHLEGHASTTLMSYTTQAPTGEEAEILAHAFRIPP